MLASLRWLVLPALLAGFLGLAAAPDALAAGPPDGFRIRDEGKFFGKEAMDKAEKTIAAIKRNLHKDLLVETYAAIPDGLKTKYKDEGKAVFFRNWARDRYNKERVSGVSLLLCKDPTYLYVEVGKETVKKAFPEANARRLQEQLVASFKEEKFDEGLIKGVEYVRDTMKANLGQVAVSTPPTPAPPKTTRPSTTSAPGDKLGASMSPLGWVCIGLAVIMGVWMIIGLFRAMSGAGQSVGRPGGNYAGNYGPGGAPAGYAGGGGGGGGGFMSGMLGGMLGGAAGAWAYDRFFRGDSGGGMTPPAYGGGTTNYGSPAAPDDSAGGGAGGDWGGGGGGGGDWGSSPADTGGGGDWGGGGGDTGGGGDWGGGGDSGGGGDWGGGGDGGGGGDW